jgi:hypothetical protein
LLHGRGSEQPDVVPGPRGRLTTRRVVLGGAAVALAAVAAAAGWPWTQAWPPLGPFLGAAAPIPTPLATPEPLSGRTLHADPGGLSALVHDRRQGLTLLLDAAQQLHQLRGGDAAGAPRQLGGDGSPVAAAAAQRPLLAGRDGDVLLVDGKRGLWQIAGSDPPRALTLKDAARWQRPAAIAAYAGNLYVLDSGGDGSPQIWRHPGTVDGGFDAPQAWLQTPSAVPLGDATAMAIDGAIWITRRNGEILRLAGGRSEPFALTGLEQPISAAGAVHTERDYRSVYVLDTALRRVVQLRKDGQFERQVLNVFPTGEVARALWVDEPAGRALVLTERRLQEVSFGTPT